MDTSTNEGLTSFQYAGFWRRFWATLLDSLLLIAISFPILYSIYGADYFLSESTYHGPADIIITYVFPLVATVLFWRYKSATPGKMALKLQVVDADTGNRLSQYTSNRSLLCLYNFGAAFGAGIFLDCVG